MQSAINDYIFVQELVIDMYEHNLTAVNETIKSNAKALTVIAKKDSKEAVAAQALLESIGQGSWKEPYKLPNIDRNKSLEQDNPFKEYAGTKSEMINVYPNPANDILQIEYLSLSGKGAINIYTLEGQQVKSIPVKSKIGFESINVSSLPSGTYIISTTEFGSKHSVKFNVTH